VEEKPWERSQLYRRPIVEVYWYPTSYEWEDDEYLRTEWNPDTQHEQFNIVWYTDSNRPRRCVIDVIRDDAHDAAIKAFVRENWKQHFTL
jgi:hypothetical protein